MNACLWIWSMMSMIVFAHMVWIMLLVAKSTSSGNFHGLHVKLIVWIMLLVTKSTGYANIHWLPVELAIWIMLLVAKSTNYGNIHWLHVELTVWILLLIVEFTSCENIHWLPEELASASLSVWILLLIVEFTSCENIHWLPLELASASLSKIHRLWKKSKCYLWNLLFTFFTLNMNSRLISVTLCVTFFFHEILVVHEHWCFKELITWNCEIWKCD